MHFSARKKHLKKQKWQFDPQHSAAQRRCQGTFFSGGNFTPIFEAKKVGTSGQNCPGHFDSSQFSPKSAIFGGFEKKKFPKVTGTKDILCMLPKYIIIHGFRPPLGKKCHNFGQKLLFSIFQKFTFLA